MSSRHRLQDGTNVQVTDGLQQAIIMSGLTSEIPADGASGFNPSCLFFNTQTGNWYINEGSVTSADFNLVTVAALTALTGTASFTTTVCTRAKVGASAGWVIPTTTDSNVMATMAASQSGGTLVIPIDGLHIGDIITAFKVIGQIESAGGTVTVDANLRYLENVAADPTDNSIGSITQVSVTADTAMAASKTSLSSVVTSGRNYYLLVTATTAGSTDIQFLGCEITCTRAVGS